MQETNNLQYIKGVGPKRVKKLNKLDIINVEDLLNYFPRKYENRSVIKKISDLIDGEKALIRVKIITPIKYSKPKRKLSIIKTKARDETGAVSLTWFNQEYLKDKILLGKYYDIYGKIKCNNGILEIINPDIETINSKKKTGRIHPIYPLTNNLTNNELVRVMDNAINSFSKYIENIIPDSIKNKYSLLEKKEALKLIHFPIDKESFIKAKRTIAFEKLLILQIGLLAVKNKLNRNNKGISFNNTKILDSYLNILHFSLTNAQIRVLNEVKNDMSSYKPMNRLIQGDVGCGKTVVAIGSMFIAVSSGYQAAMMAPTEILARQHYESIQQYALKLNINVEILTGSIKKKKKEEIAGKLKSGEIDIIIGTHALIEGEVIFKKVGLIVTDEQHRFGVRQRALLSNKGLNPDILVMTATPIPRTLALMFYGDLDISVIDEMPPGRQKVITYTISKNKKEEAFKFIKKRIDEGRQVYIVAPLIDESDKMELDSAIKMHEKLSTKYFNDYKVGLLHGKMKGSEKDEIMTSFYEGEINILVSTTVIEVGVNVPNAVIMLVLNAERFGLAQLHQLRGRVGRGSHQSYCILVNESTSKKSKERMNILTETNNGFLIAEKDLEIRGPGEFFGTKQHGIQEYELSSLINDARVVQEVQLLSKNILQENPNLEGLEYKNLKEKIIQLFKKEDIAFN